LLQRRLEELLESPHIAFDAHCLSSLPAKPGIYRIFDPSDPVPTIRAGRTNAKGGLRQRLYQNHLMGNQPGNLCSQLIRYGVCSDRAAAKNHVRTKFVAQVLIIEDNRERAWLEHFMLALLMPLYSD
jgi:hypothetical protein